VAHTCDHIHLDMERAQHKQQLDLQGVVCTTRDMIEAAAKDTSDTLKLCQVGLEGVVQVISKMQLDKNLGTPQQLGTEDPAQLQPSDPDLDYDSESDQEAAHCPPGKGRTPWEAAHLPWSDPCLGRTLASQAVGGRSRVGPLPRKQRQSPGKRQSPGTRRAVSGGTSTKDGTMQQSASAFHGWRHSPNPAFATNPTLTLTLNP